MSRLTAALDQEISRYVEEARGLQRKAETATSWALREALADASNDMAMVVKGLQRAREIVVAEERAAEVDRTLPQDG